MARRIKHPEMIHRFPIIENLTRKYPDRKYFVVPTTDELIFQNSLLAWRQDETILLNKYREFSSAVLFENEPVETNKYYVSWRFIAIYSPKDCTRTGNLIRKYSDNEKYFKGKSIQCAEEDLLKFLRSQFDLAKRHKLTNACFLSRLIRLEREVVFYES